MVFFFCAVPFSLDVLEEIWDVIESVSEGFLTYSVNRSTKSSDSYKNTFGS